MPSKDAAEVRKKPAPEIPENGGAKMAVPKSCPMAVPDADKRALSARSSFSDHSAKATRYGQELRTLLQEQRTNAETINSHIDALDRMDRKLADHRAAKIHLTKAERKLQTRPLVNKY